MHRTRRAQGRTDSAARVVKYAGTSQKMRLLDHSISFVLNDPAKLSEDGGSSATFSAYLCMVHAARAGSCCLDFSRGEFRASDKRPRASDQIVGSCSP